MGIGNSMANITANKLNLLMMVDVEVTILNCVNGSTIFNVWDNVWDKVNVDAGGIVTEGLLILL